LDAVGLDLLVPDRKNHSDSACGWKYEALELQHDTVYQGLSEVDIRVALENIGAV
jgi:hypothetical protein